MRKEFIFCPTLEHQNVDYLPGAGETLDSVGRSSSRKGVVQPLDRR